MTRPDRIEYDEFGLFHENAREYGLPFAGPPPVRRVHVDVGAGRPISALVWGTGEPELVFLHGGSQNAHTWDTVALALRPRPLIAIDLPGHGHSDDAPSGTRGASSTKQAADDIAAVIRKLAAHADGVIGMSYGGLAAIALLECAPELVRRLLLVDILPGLSSDRARHIVDFVNGPATFPSFDDLLARTIAFNPTRSTSSLRRGILHNALQLEDGTWVWRHARHRIDTPAEPASAREASSTGRVVCADLVQSLAHIAVPLLLARGMRPDSVLCDDDETALLRELPSAEVARFERAGHSIQGDMPVELAATIQAFMASSRSAGET